jgi:oligosaccharide repeat unit polymerase
MEALLFVIALIQLLFAILIIKSLIHPIVILKGAFTLSAFVLIFFSKIWGMHISLKTVLILTSALLWVDFGFIIGSLNIVASKRLKKIKDNISLVNIRTIEFSVNGAWVFFMFILVVIGVFLSFGRQYLQLDSGINDLSSSIINLKAARREGDIESLGLLQYAMTFCTIIGVVYTYAAVMEWFNNKFSSRVIILLLPVILTVVLNYLTGRRAILLTIIVVAFIIIYENYIRKYKKVPLKTQLKFLLYGIVFVALFLYLFVYLGELYNKAGKNGPLNLIAIYISGGIVSFDKVYDTYAFSSELFGQNTLRVIYKILNVIPGVNFSVDDTISSSISNGYNFVTNVYTVNLHYAADFGYMGIAICNILIGWFFSFIYKNSKKEMQLGFWSVLYAFFVMRLISYTGAEKFFVAMTLNIQYVVFLGIIFKSGLLFKKIKKTNSKEDIK